MRLTRIGSKKRPYYRIVVIDKRRARNAVFGSSGQYNPIATPVQLDINADRAQYWLSKGATPSETVRSLLRKKELVK
jgi:small subunit ribosomal protein S16